MSEFREGRPEVQLEAAQRLIDSGEERTFLQQILVELGAESPWQRTRALECVEALRPTAALLDQLETELRDDAHAGGRNAARALLAALASPRSPAPELALARLRELCMHGDEVDVRVLAATALGESGNTEAREIAEAALRDENANVAAAAADALGVLEDERAVPALARAAVEGDLWVRNAAILALGQLQSPQGIPALTAALNDPDTGHAAAAALGDVGAADSLADLRPVLEGNDEVARQIALEAAAAILSNNPGLDVPEWLRPAAAGGEAHWASRLHEAEDLFAARLLGIAGTVAAARGLVSELANPDREAPAMLGIALLPRRVATKALLESLDGAEPDATRAILSAMPPLDNRQAIEAVQPYLSRTDPRIRSAAAAALGRSDESLVRRALENALDDPEARIGAAQALGILGSPSCEGLNNLLADPDPEVRAVAADGLAHCKPVSPGPVLAALKTETAPAVHQALARALGAAGGTEAVNALGKLSTDPDPSTRFTAVEALGSTGTEEAYPALLSALGDPLPEIRAAALQAMGNLGDARAAMPLGGHLASEDRDVRRTAAFALAKVAPPDAIHGLVGALQDSDREVRHAAVQTLQRLGGREALVALDGAATSDPDPLVREAALSAIREIGDAPVPAEDR